MHSESYAVTCDASRPNGPGGCGASGRYFPTYDKAASAWNRRAALDAQKAEPLHIGACITDGKLHATVMRREANGHVTVMATAELDAASLAKHDGTSQMQYATPPTESDK